MENPDILILDEPMNGLDNQVYEMDHGKLAVSEQSIISCGNLAIKQSRQYMSLTIILDHEP